MGNPGSVLPGLTPFPVDPLDPVDPVDPLESSSELLEAIFCAQARYLSNICSENGAQIEPEAPREPKDGQRRPMEGQRHPHGTQMTAKGKPRVYI